MARWLPAGGYAGHSAGSTLQKKVLLHLIPRLIQYRCANQGIFELVKNCAYNKCEVQCQVTMLTEYIWHSGNIMTSSLFICVVVCTGVGQEFEILGWIEASPRRSASSRTGAAANLQVSAGAR